MKKTGAPKKARKGVKKTKGSVCAADGCKNPITSRGYCRLHYLSHWREIKEDEKSRAERRLNAYVDRLAKRYPEDYLEKIKEGIENEDLFKKTIEQLELDGDPDDGSETEREYMEKLSRIIKPED